MSTFALETSCSPSASEREIVLTGEFDIAAVPALEAALGGARNAGHDVALDLSRITFIDLRATRSVLDAALAASLAGRTLKLVSPSPAVERVLELTGAEDFIAATRPAVAEPGRRSRTRAGSGAR